jgi:hypothetical protein
VPNSWRDRWDDDDTDALVAAHLAQVAERDRQVRRAGRAWRRKLQCERRASRVQLRPERDS